ncbi:MAG: SprT family zinc-dependent metalloprotease [Pseudomonadota bacterium]
MEGHYRVRRSRRARLLRITVRAEGVEVVAPPGVDDADISAFVQSSQRWIDRKLSAIRQRMADHPGSTRLVDGARIPYRGALERLSVTRSGRSRPNVRHDVDLSVTLPQDVPDHLLEIEVERVLTGWLRRQARIEACALIAHYGQRHDLQPRGLKIKSHRTLWGSCTSNDVINLNWRLILAPPEALEYVVVHELCHLRHRHHQPPFWRLVADILPNYHEQRRWLRSNGHLLTLRAPQPG